MQQPNNDNNSQKKGYKAKNRLSTPVFNDSRIEKSEKKNINRNSIAPENVRYETLSWVDREFNPDAKNFNILHPHPEEDNNSEVKISFSNPGDAKIIELNNVNNTMDNRKKNRYKYISSPPNLIHPSSPYSRKDSISSQSSSDSSVSHSNLYPTSETEKPKNDYASPDSPTAPSTNLQYNTYGTFSQTSNYSPHLNYESLNAHEFNESPSYQIQSQSSPPPVLNLFKDKDPNTSSIKYDYKMKDTMDPGKSIYSPYPSEFSPIAPSIETNTTTANETTPLTVPHAPTRKPEMIFSFAKNWTIQCIKFLPAVLLGVLLNLLDSLSYGIIIFPKHEAMPSTYVQSGISMFLVSTVIAQLVYCSGLSNFRGGNGSMMIEVMPFLHIICQIVIDKVGADHPTEVIATIMVAYALSTILTGVVFYLLGAFKMGNIMSFFPRHILIGCIGGIGLFLLQTGIEIITGYSFDLTFDYIKNIFTTPTLPIWLLSMTLALGLTVVNTKVHHPLLVPSFFLILPAIFYIIVLIGGFDLDNLREKGWLFNLISSEEGESNVPFYTFWKYYNFKATQWSVLPYTFGTIFALVFFGILHVPINVPALSVSVNTDVNINKELKIHGYTNFLSGLCGSLQNYLVYSNSVLFMRSGGNSNVAGFMLALATFALLILGTSFIKFVPTIIIGGLIFHLGFDLMKEALIDTFKTVSPIEYLTIILIVICMDIWGFTEGIIVGIVVACIFFIITLSRRKIIRSVHSGSELPSTVYRLKSQKTFLNRAGVQIKVLRFQGFIFFGTFQQINDYINSMILKTETYSIKYIIFDFKLVNGMDYSASEAFIKIKSNLKKKGIYLILCNLQPTSIDPLNRVGFLSNIDEDEDNEFFKYFASYDMAIEWCENMLLETQYDASKREYLLLTNKDEGISKIMLTRDNSNSLALFPPALSPSPINSPSTPSFTDYKLVDKININDFEQPLRLLIQTLLNENNEVDMKVFVELTKYFQCFEVRKSMVLWEKSTPVSENKIYIVENGQALLYTVHESSNNIIKEKVIGTLIPYSVIGDVEFFSKIPHRTKLVAQEGSKIWAIDYSNYEHLCNQYPEIALKFVQLILHCSSERMENMLKHDFIKSCY